MGKVVSLREERGRQRNISQLTPPPPTTRTQIPVHYPIPGHAFDSWLSETSANIARLNFRLCVVAEPSEKGGCKITWAQYFTFPSAFIPNPVLGSWVGPEYFSMTKQVVASIPGPEALAALHEETRGKALSEHVFAGVGWKTKAFLEEDSIYRAAFHDSGVVSNFTTTSSAVDGIGALSKGSIKSAHFPDASRRVQRFAASTLSRRNQQHIRADKVARRRVKGISKRIVQNHHVTHKKSAGAVTDGRQSSETVSSSHSAMVGQIIHHAATHKHVQTSRGKKVRHDRGGGHVHAMPPRAMSSHSLDLTEEVSRGEKYRLRRACNVVIGAPRARKGGRQAWRRRWRRRQRRRKGQRWRRGRR